ncbi:MarR family transcriptional regulator [Cognatishimia sp. WU-CL00825]|uniref:MarR family winged helix-turn-helix transcriptional regulator n=1 Tax=Cognatishimia sp. WU-CL00825 TaxID=3127658 RepID=UPI00310BE728
MSKPDENTTTIFRLINEIMIIAQLSGRLFERRLPDGFLVSHFSVLNHLVRLGDGRTPLAIARALQVPKTSMTHTLAGLRKAGLVSFEPNPTDSRSKCVMLTEAGRQFRDAAIAGLGPDVAKFEQVIPSESVSEILPMLENIRAYLDQERDG